MSGVSQRACRTQPSLWQNSFKRVVTVAVSKLTNACVEVGLICLTILLGVLGWPVWAMGGMIAVSLIWWGFVHQKRLQGMAALKAFGGIGVAALMLAIGHAIAFFLGAAINPMLEA